jgi:NAD(P)-dependent dehydrogenase (short-subunit alcohol dehydrogenase family)
MSNQLQGKVAAITGGGSGIGRASVLRFLNEGAQVVVLDINEKSGAETIKIASEAGYKDSVRFRRCDISNEPEMESAIKYAVNEFGRLDCMFNNAGLSGAVGPITKTKVEDWDRTCAVLLRGVFIGTKHAALAMGIHKQGGTIINTSSIAGLSAGAGGPAYSSCKAAVINFTRSAAVELAAEKIRVNAICPGIILTPLVHRGDEKEVEQVFSEGQPWPEPGRPEHIANVALFLATDQSRFITGEYITVDGGLNALGPGIYAGSNPAGNAVIEKIFKSLGITIPEDGEIPTLFDAGSTGL